MNDANCEYHFFCVIKKAAKEELQKKLKHINKLIMHTHFPVNQQEGHKYSVDTLRYKCILFVQLQTLLWP